MDFYQACNEVYFILENLNPEEKKKIPEGVIQFFHDNQLPHYTVTIDLSKPLEEQALLDETRVFLHILYTKYLK